MIGSAPSFPAFEDWEKMSEREQDALIRKIEITRRRNARIFGSLALIGVCTGISLLVYLLGLIRF